MGKIVRTPTRAEGGITEEEKAKLDLVAKEWINIALRTKPIEPEKIIPAIEGLYAVANLKKPRVVIVPSPLVMAFAYGAAAWIWYCRKNHKNRSSTNTATANIDATEAATVVATEVATYSAAYAATRAATIAATDDATIAATIAATRAATEAATTDATDDATIAATDDATRAATRAATEAAVLACQNLAGEGGLMCSKRWWNSYQGGNMWASWVSYIVGMRDVIGLSLKEFEKFKYLEEAAKEGGFRVLHEEFCLVSDFPEFIKMDDARLPHCENGPSHRWRDGWSLYHWHGVSIPGEWVTGKPPTASEAISWSNIEQRRAACEIVGWGNILSELNSVSIDVDDPEIGELLECEIPDSGKEKFLRVRCGTGRDFTIPVPRKMKTALEANAWTYGLDAKDLKVEVRT